MASKKTVWFLIYFLSGLITFNFYVFQPFYAISPLENKFTTPQNKNKDLIAQAALNQIQSAQPEKTDSRQIATSIIDYCGTWRGLSNEQESLFGSLFENNPAVKEFQVVEEPTTYSTLIQIPENGPQKELLIKHLISLGGNPNEQTTDKEGKKFWVLGGHSDPSKANETKQLLADKGVLNTTVAKKKPSKSVILKTQSHDFIEKVTNFVKSRDFPPLSECKSKQ